MIEIDFSNRTYTCPHCGREQALSDGNYTEDQCGFFRRTPIKFDSAVTNTYTDIYSIRCANNSCKKITVVSFFPYTKEQIDLFPQNVYKLYPEYVPQQIRDDYKEACTIINNSPKAAATLLRRCLQGMIRDFWGIHGKNLNAEITALQEKVPVTQWKALDGLRQIGNIGAHMEQDVNIIIDIDVDEAKKLKQLIELLIEKWYIARHDEETLYSEITGISDEKQEQKAMGIK